MIMIDFSKGLLLPLDSTCIDGAVHLVGGAHISRGRVEYCHNGSWYSVCASDWDITGEEARAICQSIDYYIPPWSKCSPV